MSPGVCARGDCHSATSVAYAAPEPPSTTTCREIIVCGGSEMNVGSGGLCRGDLCTGLDSNGLQA